MRAMAKSVSEAIVTDPTFGDVCAAIRRAPALPLMSRHWLPCGPPPGVKKLPQMVWTENGSGSASKPKRLFAVLSVTVTDVCPLLCSTSGVLVSVLGGLPHVPHELGTLALIM